MLIHKNNSDRKGNCYGSHENYLIDRRTPFKQIVEHLMPFFVTRQVYCGAGKVGSENRGHPVDYQISQRADFFETEVALDTMVKRPIINTRDEPHADREKYRRLHVIVGDSNLCEYTIYLRNGVTAIVLAMIEDGAITQEPLAARPGASDQGGLARPDAASTSSRSTTASAATRSRSRRSTSRWRSRTPPSSRSTRSRRTCSRSGSTCSTRSPRSDGARREIDWVMKKAMIERFMERKSLDWNSPQVQMLDLQYHDLRPEKGLYYLLERQGRAERIVTDDEILARGPHAAGRHARLFPRGVPQEVRSGGVRSQLGFDLVRRRRASRSSAS